MRSSAVTVGRVLTGLAGLLAFAISLYAPGAKAWAAEPPVPQPAPNPGFQSNEFRSKVKALSASRYWHRLLHYKPRWFGGVKSEADGQAFFLSPRGGTEPEEELWADLEAFATGRKVGTRSQDAQCLFPERYRFLKTELGLALRDAECPEFKKWRSEVDGESVTLVFSSYFTGAPASMFGHTFLRLDHSKSAYTERSGTRLGVLETAIDFSAMTGNDWMVIQAIKGLIGHYPGRYSIWPYFVKIKEYNNAEHRDLYEYELNLNREEVSRMLAHLWELGGTYFDYYFLDDNCSYELLTLLEVAKPQWELSTGFFTHAIPIDTVRRVIEQPGALKSVRFRPALTRKLQQKWSVLSDSERSEYFEVLDGELAPDRISSPLLAEALNSHYMIAQIEGKGTLAEKDARIFRGALVRRSQLPALDEERLPPIEESRPDLGHYTAKVGLGAGYAKREAFKQVGIRPALHDLLDYDQGYTSYSSLEFLGGRLRYYDRSGQFVLDDLKILNLTSLNPYERVGNKISYQLDAAIRNPRDLACRSCLAFHLGVGVGMAPNLSSSRVLPYVLPYAQLDAGGAGTGFRYGPGLLVGIASSPANRYKVVLQGKWNEYLSRAGQRNLELELGQSFGWSQRWETRLVLFSVLHRTLPSREFQQASFDLNFYF